VVVLGLILALVVAGSVLSWPSRWSWAGPVTTLVILVATGPKLVTDLLREARGGGQ
jgi:hypothetical protein